MLQLPKGQMNKLPRLDTRFKYYESQIVEERSVCPHCGSDYDGDYRGCCGEVHTETLYTFDDGEELLESEVRILPGDRPLTEDELEAMELERLFEMGRVD
jgi:hypothetical protein